MNARFVNIHIINTETLHWHIALKMKIYIFFKKIETGVNNNNIKIKYILLKNKYNS